jgi:hypothetical protein
VSRWLGGGGNALFSLGDKSGVVDGAPADHLNRPPPVVTDPVSMEYARLRSSQKRL